MAENNGTSSEKDITVHIKVEGPQSAPQKPTKPVVKKSTPMSWINTAIIWGVSLIAVCFVVYRITDSINEKVNEVPLAMIDKGLMPQTAPTVAPVVIPTPVVNQAAEPQRPVYRRRAVTEEKESSSQESLSNSSRKSGCDFDLKVTDQNLPGAGGVAIVNRTNAPISVMMPKWSRPKMVSPCTGSLFGFESGEIFVMEIEGKRYAFGPKDKAHLFQGSDYRNWRHGQWIEILFPGSEGPKIRKVR